MIVLLTIGMGLSGASVVGGVGYIAYQIITNF
jgi:hypothetical protein